jgi:cytochrome b561
MAAMVLTMLFIGVGMVSTVSGRYHALIGIHRPLGIAILVLALIRLANRLLNPGPPLPAHLNSLERCAARASQVLLYALMILMPLVGWAMLSAGGYPIVLAGAVHLPAILPQDLPVYALLRRTHTLLAYAFFATFIAHFGAALMHGLIYRDGVFASMVPWRSRAARPASPP